MVGHALLTRSFFMLNIDACHYSSGREMLKKCYFLFPYKIITASKDHEGDCKFSVLVFLSPRFIALSLSLCISVGNY